MSVIAGERSVAEAARREKVSEYNTVRPHEAIAWNRPLEVHLGLADPMTPNFPETQSLPTA